MLLKPKPMGGPIQKFWDSQEILRSMDGVKKWLCENAQEFVQSAPPTAKSLAKLVSMLIQFQEDQIVSGGILRLPIRLFLDFSPDGSLCRIFAAMYKFKTEQSWERFNLDSHLIKRKNLSMLTEIKQVLIDHGLYSLPKLYLARNLADFDRQKVGRLADTFNMTLTEDETEASHIIHPSMIADKRDAYCRPMFKVGQKYLVHFNGLPDSRDNWGVLDLMEDKKPNDFSGEKIIRKNQYRVVVEWIYDLEKHKEFMSEEDYEVDKKGDLIVHKLDMTYDAFASACKRRTKKRAPSAPITDVKSKRTVQEWQVVLQQDTQKVARDKDAQIQLMEARLRDKDAQIQLWEARLRDKDAQIQLWEARLRDKDARLKDEDAQIQPWEARLRDKDARLRDKDAQIQLLEARLRDKDARLKDEDAQIQLWEARLRDKDARLRDKDARLRDKDARLRDKDAQIQLLEARLRDKDGLIKEKEAHTTRERDTMASYTSSLQEIVNSLKSNSRPLSVNSNILTEAMEASICLPGDNDNRHQGLQHHGSIQLQVLMTFKRQLRVRRPSKQI